MTISQKIAKWFDDECPYLVGVSLYQQIGGAYPVSTFLGYENAPFVPTNIENRLQYALRSYLSEHPAEAVIEPQENRDITPTASILAQFNTVSEDEAEPPQILELRARAKALHKRHSEAKGRLNLMAKDQDKYSNLDRYEVAHEIMSDINPKLDGIYDRIRAWSETGELPAATSSGVVEETVQKMLRRESLRSRISRLKSLIKKEGDDVAVQKYQKEKLDKEVELKGICEELGL